MDHAGDHHLQHLALHRREFHPLPRRPEQHSAPTERGGARGWSDRLAGVLARDLAAADADHLLRVDRVRDRLVQGLQRRLPVHRQRQRRRHRRSGQGRLDHRFLSLAAGVPVLSRGLRRSHLRRVLPLLGGAHAVPYARCFTPGLLRVRTRRTAQLGVRYGVLILAAVIFLFPFYWMLVTSVNRPDTVFDFPPVLWPQWQFGNYAQAWQASNW